MATTPGAVVGREWRRDARYYFADASVINLQVSFKYITEKGEPPW